MQQKARVARLLPRNRAEVCVTRKSACSGDCHKCAGCGAVEQTLTVVAANDIHAAPGDMVYIESYGAMVLCAAVLVYVLPLVLFFAGYFAAGAIGIGVGWGGAAGFLLGGLCALWYDRRVRRRPPVYRIVEFVQ